MDKYQSFWPLPGGWEDFVHTLQEVLTFIKENSPSEERLRDWFVKNFEKTRGGSTGYIRTTLFHTGLVNHDKKTLSLTDAGMKYLEDPDNSFLFRILDQNVLGFRETLEAVSQKEMDLEELAKILERKLGLGWEKIYGQPYWRVSWLRSMGFVLFEGGKFKLTQSGRKLMNSLPQVGEPVQKPIQMEEKKKAIVDEEKRVSFPGMQEIIKNLTGAQHLSQEPSKFEDAIAQAFTFLGFSTTWLGKPGDTDVFATAHLGNESYSVVVDGKTTQGDKIIERQINWPSLSDHKNKHHADFIGVVGVSFAGGDLIERAEKFEVTLIETETLIKLLEIHDDTPLDLEDLKGLFLKKGLLRLEDCSELMIVKAEYEKNQELIPRVFESLRRLQQQGEHTNASDIRWELQKAFEQEDILNALDLLEKWGFVKKAAGEQWISLMPSRVAAKRLTIIANSLESEGETRHQ